MKKQDYEKMVLILALSNALLIRGYLDREAQIREEKIKDIENENKPIQYENPYIDLGDGFYKSKEDGTIYKKETHSENATKVSDGNYTSYRCPVGYALYGTTCTKTTMELYQDESKQLKRK